MDASTFLLYLLNTFFLLFTLFWLSPLSYYLSSPTNDLIDALTISKFNQYEPKSQPIGRLVKAFPLSSYDNDFNNLTTNTRPILDNKNLVGLAEDNFTDFLTKNKYVLVMYHATWCTWSKQLVPEYAAAAKMLKGEAVLAMVDATEDGLRRKYHVKVYPTIQLFVGGVRQYDYGKCGERTGDAITTWVKSKMSIGTYSITTMEEAQRILAAESKLVLGFFDNLEGAESEEFAAASKLQSDMNFYRTASADVAELFHIERQIKRPALILFQTLSGNSSLFCGDQFTRLAIADFVSKVNFPLIIKFNARANVYKILYHPMKQLWLFAPRNGSEEIFSIFEEAAKAFEGKLLFVYAEMNFKLVGTQLSLEFGITGDAPTVVGRNQYNNDIYRLKGELTLSNIKFFGKYFLENKLLSQ